MIAIEERDHVYQELVEESGIDPFDYYSPSSTDVRKSDEHYQHAKLELCLISTDPRYGIYYEGNEVRQDGV